jgi:hypothetical protein
VTLAAVSLGRRFRCYRRKGFFCRIPLPLGFGIGIYSPDLYLKGFINGAEVPAELNHKVA